MSDFDPATEQFERVRNRHGLILFVKIITPTDQPVRGNLYLAHGFRDVHDTPHMRALTQAGARSGYRVIVWDASHSWGRSEGQEVQATFYFHYEDLEDVIFWSRNQPWFEERFMLGGHSLGGMAVGTFAASHPQQVSGLILLAPVVSGRALRRRIPGIIRFWWRRRGTIRLPKRGPAEYSWEFIRSSWAYDLLANAGRLTMPVLLIAAGRDWIIPVKLMRRLARMIGDSCEFVIVSFAKHGFDLPAEAQMADQTVRNWLQKPANLSKK